MSGRSLPATPADPTAALYLHESIARWEGWSLSAPRPGLAMTRSPHAPSDDDPDTQPVPDRNEALPDGVPLEVTFRTAGGLPRLRVGGAYRLRARAVDLAGDGPTLGEADALLDGLAAAGEPVPTAPGEREGPLEFTRFEPLQAPPVVLRRPVTEGESVEHVVVRSDHDVSAGEYAAANGGDPDAERHVVPSKVAVQDAELLRCFDEAIGQRDPAAAARTYAVALREAGTLDRAVVWDPDLGAERPLDGVELVPPQADDPNSGYVIHTEDEVEVPYLPDPWSAGACFVGLPGIAAGTVVRIGADGTSATAPDEPRLDPRPQPGVLIVDWGGRDPWWMVRPLRLRVVEGDGPPGWDAASRVLTVELPKAVQADVRISSVLDEHRLDEHGAWRAVMRRVASSGADLAPYVQLARTGRLWAVTPARTVRLVHALQRPLHAPDVIALRARRELGATWTLLAGEVRLHGASTDRIDLEASWTDVIDDPRPAGRACPESEERTAHALSQQVLLARDVAVRATVRRGADGTLRRGRRPPRARRRSGMAGRPTVHVGPRAAQHEAPARHVHGDGDITLPRVLPAASARACLSRSTRAVGARRRRRAELVATAAARPALRRAAVRLGAQRGGQDPDHHAARGRAAPVPRAAVAGLGRRRAARCRAVEGVDARRARHRATSSASSPRGGSIRCGRPRSPPPAPSPMSFRRRVVVGEDLPLLEAPDIRVTVAGHEVVYDEFRDMWTCDVELDVGGAYTPFVRLGLVRYQPSSVAGAHLSAVAVAQIAQVSPERIVSLTAASDDPLLFSVAVSGPGHGAAWQTGGMPFPYGSDVEVFVEQRIEGVADPDLCWQRQPAASAVLDHGPPPSGNFIRWSGRVRLPATHQPDAAPHRRRRARAPGDGRPGALRRRRPTDTDDHPHRVRRDVRRVATFSGGDALGGEDVHRVVQDGAAAAGRSGPGARRRGRGRRCGSRGDRRKYS